MLPDRPNALGHRRRSACACSHLRGRTGAWTVSDGRPGAREGCASSSFSCHAPSEAAKKRSSLTMMVGVLEVVVVPEIPGQLPSEEPVTCPTQRSLKQRVSSESCDHGGTTTSETSQKLCRVSEGQGEPIRPQSARRRTSVHHVLRTASKGHTFCVPARPNGPSDQGGEAGVCSHSSPDPLVPASASNAAWVIIAEPTTTAPAQTVACGMVPAS